MNTTLLYTVVVLLVSAFFASVGIVVFILGVRYGNKQAAKYKPAEIKVIEVEKPFVVEKEVVREVTTPGFVYTPRGTPNPKQEAADRKMQELVSEAEL